MSSRGAKITAWAGPAGMLSFGIGVSPFVANFIPIPSPSLTGEAAAALFTSNPIGTRIAGGLMLLAAALLSTFFAGISGQLRRIESRGSPYASAQLALGTFANVGFYVGAVCWFAAAFRPERSVAEISLLYDLSWLMLVSPGAAVMAQLIPVALAIFEDSNPTPLFPRWVAYLNVWVAILFAPAMLVPFFLDGPFAWNGLLGFWVAAIGFSIWTGVMCWGILRAAKRTDIPS